MVRYTVRDHDKTVSFLDDKGLAPRLVAACAADPNLLEELLIAAEPLQPGIVAKVTRALLRYDSALRTQATLPVFAAFEVMDRATSYLAQQPDGEGLLVIDLPARTIHNRIPGNSDLSLHGSVRTQVTGANLERETVYALNQDWTFVTADVAGDVLTEKSHYV